MEEIRWGMAPLENIPCRYHFGDGCRYGENCFYSHNEKVFMAVNNLRHCPNEGCLNYCRGRQCRECHDKKKFKNVSK